MEREQIIRMARKAGLEKYHLPDSMMEYEFDRCIERFAALVAAAERNAILQMSREQWFKTQADFEDAIRARGQG